MGEYEFPLTGVKHKYLEVTCFVFVLLSEERSVYIYLEEPKSLLVSMSFL